MYAIRSYYALNQEFEQLQAEITRVADKTTFNDQNAMVIDKSDAAAMGDIVTVDYVELDSDNNEVAGSERNNFV